MANAYRGEVDVTLCGKEYTLRPSFTSCVEFESTTGVSIFEALEDIRMKQRLPIDRVAVAIWAGIRGFNPDSLDKCPSLKEVGELVFRNGVADLLNKVFTFLGNAIAGEEALRVDTDAEGQEPGNEEEAK